MKSKSYTKKGSGRVHNHETVAKARKRFLAHKAKLVGAAQGMAQSVEIVHGGL